MTSDVREHATRLLARPVLLPCTFCRAATATTNYAVLENAPSAGQAASAPAQETAIIDTDIGDDFDDASAMGLAALSSPELKIIGSRGMDQTAPGTVLASARAIQRRKSC